MLQPGDRPPPRPRRRGLSYERRIFGFALLVALPSVALALALLILSDLTSQTTYAAAALLLALWFGSALMIRERVIRPLQTLSNLVGALREGDYSLRARGARTDDSLGLALYEVNELGVELREQRAGALEATALLRTVMAEIDVAVIAFDSQLRLQLANRAAERLLGQPLARLLGQTAEKVGLDNCLTGSAPRTFFATFPGGSGQWELRRSVFRQQGSPHQLLVLTDVSRALREQEREAWQRLIRVLSHEINNSLTPIQSIAGSLANLLAQDRPSDDWREDMTEGLSVISGRSLALGRFMSSYAKLARLPQPTLAPISISDCVLRVAALETRMGIAVADAQDITLLADQDQLEQLLINLITNAVDASPDHTGVIRIGWTSHDDEIALWVDDDGPGISSTANLFVPFFTTKANGSGIGLVLSRQIAEGHGGTLTLTTRSEGGTRAELRLPIRTPDNSQQK